MLRVPNQEALRHRDAHRHTLDTDFIETFVGKPLGLAYFFIATPSSRSALQVRAAFLALIGVILLMIMQVFIDGDYIREIFIGGDYWVSYCVYAPRVAQRMTSTYMVHIFGIQCKDGIAERSQFFFCEALCHERKQSSDYALSSLGPPAVSRAGINVSL